MLAYRNDAGDFNAEVIAFAAQLDLQSDLAPLEVEHLKTIAWLRE